jgi:hypothetical protein
MMTEPARPVPTPERYDRPERCDFAEIAATIDRTRDELLAIHDRLAVRWRRPSEVARCP